LDKVTNVDLEEDLMIKVNGTKQEKEPTGPEEHANQHDDEYPDKYYNYLPV